MMATATPAAPAAAPVQPQAKAGYMTADRPQCGNCWRCEPKQKAPLCQHHGFEIEATAWCPVWFPRDEWVRRNAHTAAKLGIFVGPAA